MPRYFTRVKRFLVKLERARRIADAKMRRNGIWHGIHNSADRPVLQARSLLCVVEYDSERLPPAPPHYAHPVFHVDPVNAARPSHRAVMNRKSHSVALP